MPDPWITKQFDMDMQNANLLPLSGMPGQWFGRFTSQVMEQDHIVVVRVQKPKRGMSEFAFQVDVDGGREQRVGSGNFDQIKFAIDLALLNIDIQLFRQGKSDKPDKFGPKVRFK